MCIVVVFYVVVVFGSVRVPITKLKHWRYLRLFVLTCNRLILGRFKTWILWGFFSVILN